MLKKFTSVGKMSKALLTFLTGCPSLVTFLSGILMTSSDPLKNYPFVKYHITTETECLPDTVWCQFGNFLFEIYSPGRWEANRSFASFGWHSSNKRANTKIATCGHFGIKLDMRRQYLCKRKPDLLCFLKSTSVQLHVLSFVTFSILPVKCHNYLMSWEPMVSSLKGGWDRSYNTHWCWRTSLNEFYLQCCIICDEVDVWDGQQLYLYNSRLM